MRALTATVSQVVILIVVASGLGVVANQMREPTFDANRNWFPEGPAPSTKAKTNKHNNVVAPKQPVEIDHQEQSSIPTVSGNGEAAESTADTPEEPTKHIAHEFGSVTTKEAAEIVGSPDWEGELTVFVDARSDAEYQKGHIPGAFHLFYYQIDDYWPDIKMNVLNALRIVVYCNGGECEDSILLARDLYSRGVDPSALAIYEGGWERWSGGGHPIVTGSERYESDGE
jgi:rhodanese-related sulfurtransferase